MNIVKGLRAWLIFFRTHTAILEAPMAALGAALAIGSFWNVEVLKWAIFGIFYHFVGYGQNSYTDWKKGYDKDDPNKAHHPLNTGDISPETAKYAVQILLLTLIAYGAIASRFKIQSLAIMALMILTGVAYNYIGKLTEHKYILVAIVHTTVFILPYSSYDKPFTNVIWLAILAYFIHHVFQILISGDVKDIEQDESSLIQSIGMSIESNVKGYKVLTVTPRVIVLSYLIAIIESIIVLGILLILNPPPLTVVLTLIMMAWMIAEVDSVIGGGIYDRQKRVSAMSRKELAGFWMIFAALTGGMGIDVWIGMVTISMLYFIPVSKFMWGSMTPDV